MNETDYQDIWATIRNLRLRLDEIDKMLAFINGRIDQMKGRV